jgi:hypothetical protein
MQNHLGIQEERLIKFFEEYSCNLITRKGIGAGLTEIINDHPGAWLTRFFVKENL